MVEVDLRIFCTPGCQTPVADRFLTLWMKNLTQTLLALLALLALPLARHPVGIAAQKCWHIRICLSLRSGSDWHSLYRSILNGLMNSHDPKNVKLSLNLWKLWVQICERVAGLVRRPNPKENDSDSHDQNDDTF